MTRDPDYTYRCTGPCRQLLDEDEHRPLKVNGLNVCPECCEMCEFCSEWLDDEQAKLWGPSVKAVLPETDHRYTVGHAHCVGQWILGLMAGDAASFDVDDYTKEEIAEFYVMARLREQPFDVRLQHRLYELRTGAVYA